MLRMATMAPACRVAQSSPTHGPRPTRTTWAQDPTGASRPPSTRQHRTTSGCRWHRIRVAVPVGEAALSGTTGPPAPRESGPPVDCVHAPDPVARGRHRRTQRDVPRNRRLLGGRAADQARHYEDYPEFTDLEDPGTLSAVGLQDIGTDTARFHLDIETD